MNSGMIVRCRLYMQREETYVIRHGRYSSASYIGLKYLLLTLATTGRTVRKEVKAPRLKLKRHLPFVVQPSGKRQMGLAYIYSSSISLYLS